MSVLQGIEFLFNNRNHVTVDNVVEGARKVGSDGFAAAKAFREGAASFDRQIIDGLIRTADGWNFSASDRQVEIAEENEAFVALIVTTFRTAGRGVSDPLSNLIETSLAGFFIAMTNEDVKIKATDAIRNQSQRTAGKKAAKKLLTKKLVPYIIQEIVKSHAFKNFAARLGLAAGAAETGIGVPVALVLIQSFLQEASKASRRLRILDPNLFFKLRGAPLPLGTQIKKVTMLGLDAEIGRSHAKKPRNLNPTQPHKAKPVPKPAGLDMLYFLAEPHLGPYIRASVFARNNPEAFTKVMGFLANLDSRILQQK